MLQEIFEMWNFKFHLSQNTAMQGSWCHWSIFCLPRFGIRKPRWSRHTLCFLVSSSLLGTIWGFWPISQNPENGMISDWWKKTVGNLLLNLEDKSEAKEDIVEKSEFRKKHSLWYWLVFHFSNLFLNLNYHCFLYG